MHAKTAVAVAGAFALAGLAAGAAPRPIPAPPGVGVRVTIEGPVFTDSRGRTLYYAGACSTERRAKVRPHEAEGDVPFAVQVERTRSCLEKNPPLLAPANARPVGKWSVVARPDGAPQWAYDGRPLHTSTKDKAPGDVNGSYLIRLGRAPSNAAVAPMAGLPSGVKLRETAAGLTLVTHNGRSLYAPDRGTCDRDCQKTWRPFTAPAAAGATGLGGDWSIVEREGLRLWAHKGQPLYTYAYDAPAHGEQIFGDTYGGGWARPIKGWRVAVVLPAPRHPAEVTVQTLPGDPELFSFGLPKTVYADPRGHTLYTLHCVDSGDEDGDVPGGLACDDVGDDPRYWLAYCGGEARCARTWRPLPAPAGAKALDGVWSVALINPRHPFKAPTAADQARVWAYRGRPVFTYAGDALPGDFYGDDHGFGTTGAGQLQARPIPAYAHAPARRPVVALAPRK
jgi:predicted lipoprotein with Yx(FWY)xxD motif